ncbi:MAG: WYL domain-containing protein [Succinivibrionaceae bacterium]
MPVVLSKKSNAPKPGTSKWSQERRLEFIDYRLCWNGHINRSDLVDFFGISVPQSSLDLSKYLEMAPGNLVYDRHYKLYVRSSKYKPLYKICQPASYLNDLYLNAMGNLNPQSNYLDKAPNVACFMPPKRHIDFDVLSNIVYCINNHKAIRISYQSMSSLEPSTRLISPHSFGFDGIRWHVRAYCHSKDTFRDFVLSRILSTGKVEESPVDPNEDMQWNFIVSLHIMPNPYLSDSQKKAVELDYGMENGEVVYKCRQALLFYTLQTLNLRIDDNDDIEKAEPYKYQVVLKNKKDIAILSNFED